MDGEARMFFEPFFDLGMLVRGVIVADQVQLFSFRRLTVDLAQECQPFGVAVALVTTGDDRTVQ